MNRWNLSFVVVDYFRMRRKQLGREVSDEEVRAVNGFVEYLINVEAVEEGGRHEQARHDQ